MICRIITRPAVRQYAATRHLQRMAGLVPSAQADSTSSYVVNGPFSPAEDPQAAAAIAKTLAEAMCRGEESQLFCAEPELGFQRFHAIVTNYQLALKHARMLYTLQPSASQTLGTSPPPCVAFAYWYPEEKEPEGAYEQAGIIDESQFTRPEAAWAYKEFIELLEQGKHKFHEQHGPFLCLAFLATAPNAQGQGLGSRLMAHLLARADAAGKWTYLEATNDNNARLYERYGFKRLEGWEKQWTVESVPELTAGLIPMGRPPRPQD